MISIHCTHCKQLLEMDDAFAGGVCRCQYCKTIQTVPSSAKRKSSSGKSSSSSKPAKALYKTPDSALNELAQVVASSGLARKDLAKKKAPTPSDASASETPVVAKKPKSMVPIWIGGAAAAVVLLIVVVVMMKPGKPAQDPSTPTPGSGGSLPAALPGDPGKSEPPMAAVSGPAFADIPLPGSSVVYLIDRSQANGDSLDTVQAAVYKSILSLGRARRFQIVYWSRADEGLVAYPEDSLDFATQSEVDSASKRFEDVVAYGKTELKPTIEKALRHKPAAVVILTAKGYAMDETDIAAVKTATNGAAVKVHTVSIGDPGGQAESKVLKDIAAQNNGTYRELSLNQLQEYLQ